jgi:alkyl hydroperoxide reductase subunit AhpF
VIEDSAIAASPAAGKPESVSGVVPTGDINRVPKDGSIIATGSGNTAGARRTPA